MAEWEAAPKHHQPYGIVHGGVHCSVVETLASFGGATWLGDRGQVVGVNNNTDFYRAVREGTMTSTATPDPPRPVAAGLGGRDRRRRRPDRRPRAGPAAEPLPAGLSRGQQSSATVVPRSAAARRQPASRSGVVAAVAGEQVVERPQGTPEQHRLGPVRAGPSQVELAADPLGQPLRGEDDGGVPADPAQRSPQRLREPGQRPGRWRRVRGTPRAASARTESPRGRARRSGPSRRRTRRASRGRWLIVRP